MKKFKTLASIFLFFIIFSSSLSLSLSANAQTSGDNSPATQQETQANAFAQSSGLNPTTSVGDIVAEVIETALGLLGIIFLVLLVLAGFNWMTADGNEEKIEKAKQTITRAIIGLAIVIAAYSITYFVFNALNKAAGNESTGTVNQSQSS
jgi:amino acid transporter